MSKFTPGPWKFYQNTKKEWFITAKMKASKVDMSGADIECRIADVFGLEANAHLISAAPDLLETAKEVIQKFNVPFNANGRTVALDKLKQAISKAEGK